jgi:GH24 family phage-related lysozyme (muramidase)
MVSEEETQRSKQRSRAILQKSNEASNTIGLYCRNPTKQAAQSGYTEESQRSKQHNWAILQNQEAFRRRLVTFKIDHHIEVDLDPKIFAAIMSYIYK